MKADNALHKTNKSLSFWQCAGLIAVLFVANHARDISRPFYGLHSWAKSTGAWGMRSHIKYGLKYTKGMTTWAVGNPPTENPQRYVDHPQLAVFIGVIVMLIFGVTEFSYRLAGCIQSLLALLIFLKILKGLLDERTALLAGLIYVLFPLSGYFGFGGWPAVTGFSAMWFYLVLIGAIRGGPEPGRMHKFGLAASLFLTLQFGWTGFFYAFAIGVHYVGLCILNRRLPDKGLLAILIIAPLSSLFLNFAFMAAGYGWDVQKIVDLYKWRSAKGEMREFLWGPWFAKFWEFALTNFTLPILITAAAYLTFGQLLVFIREKPKGKEQRRPRQFPQFWLFVMTPVFQLFILRGCLWKHQTWEMPFGPFIAIAAALGILMLSDILKKIHRRLAVAAPVVLMAVFVVFCIKGTNYYHAVRWQAPEKIRMFKMLNQMIPPDKALLSFDPFIVNQHSAKGAFYRPEIAWYLDREIVQAGTVKNRSVMVAETIRDIEQKAATGRYPYYMVPRIQPTLPLISQLSQRYKYQFVPGVSGEKTEDGKFLTAGMTDYVIFDLHNEGPGS